MISSLKQTKMHRRERMIENPTREQVQKEIAALRRKAVSSENMELTSVEALDFPVRTALPPHRAVAESLTKRKGIKKEFGEMQGSLGVLINIIKDGAFIADVEEKILSINDAMIERLGKKAQDIVGTTLSVWMDGEEIRLYRRMANEALRRRASVRFENGRGGHNVENIVYPIVNLMGSVTSLAVITREMTQGRAKDGKIAYVAMNDRNPGPPPAEYLQEITHRAVEFARKGNPSSLVYLNLHNFEYIESLIGRNKSNEVLITLSGLLKNSLRAGDVIVRTEKNSFVFVLLGVPGSDGAFAAHRLQFAVNTFHFRFEGKIYYLANNMSLVEIDGTLEAPMILSLAAKACREGRKKGKDCPVVVKQKK